MFLLRQTLLLKMLSAILEPTERSISHIDLGEELTISITAAKSLPNDAIMILWRDYNASNFIAEQEVV